jgi:hypothetical protein
LEGFAVENFLRIFSFCNEFKILMDAAGKKPPEAVGRESAVPKREWPDVGYNHAPWPRKTFWMMCALSN